MPGVPFRPVRGLEKTILGLGYTDGHIYIATDTGKMFIDADGINKKPLGGSGAAVMYASALTVAERADGTYNMAWADLDDELSMPKVDDLIINSDGRFFRVLRADLQSGIINCSLIAVSGTGGGGGGVGPGGGGGGEPGQTGIKLEALDSVPTTFIHGLPYNLRFRATAVNDNLVYITYTILSDLSGNIVLPARIVRSGEIDTIDIGSLLPAESGLAIRVDATSDNDGSASPLIYRYRSSIELLLRPSSNFNPLNVQTGVLEFSCIPVGQGLSKTLRIYVDGNIISELTRENITTTEAAVSSQIPAQSHGVHTIRAVLSTGTGLNEVLAPALEYEVVWNTGESTPLIWFNTNNPTSIVNHDRLNIQYMVYDPAANPATAHFYLNGDEIPTSPLTINYNSSNYETWNVINYRVGNNILNITCGSASRQIEILVNEDTSRDMDIIQGNLTLSLSSMGRSNRENRTSRLIWSYTNKNNETYTAELKNFNWYNNGWISDEDGDTCLRISNGASVRIPIKVLETMRLQNGLAFEIMFKLRNVQSYKTLITTESTEDDDGNVTITKQISTNESVFCRYYNNDIGFCLGTLEAFFKTANNATVSGRYKEDELITISFVIENPSSSDRPLIYMYINGIMSGIIDYKKDTDSFEARAAAIEFISDYCDIDLYNVRVYKGALTSIEVVHNYIADKQDTELYDMNEIVAYNNNVPTIDYNRLLDYNRNHPENPTLPYAVLQCLDGANNDLLPYVKGGKVKCNVTFVNPSLDIAYNNGEVSDEKYITSCPSFTAQGASFDVQGTSSQGYPRRNYKGKFKDCGDTWVYTNGPLKDKPFLSKNEFNGKTYKNYYMDNTQGAEKTFTWKTDYMDSSAVHNTGFASFVKTMYSKHPLTDLLPDKYTLSNTNELRTTIYGFPMIVFLLHKDGTYEFIGRYNFNLDKGCNDVIGFERDDKHPYVEGKTIEEVAECWEFCDNQGTRCSFKKVDFAETNDAGELTVNDNFEYRYSFYEDLIDECLDGEGDFAAQSQLQRNAYMLERFANLEKVCKWINSTDTQATTNSPLPLPVTYNGKLYDDDTVEYRLAKFTNEFSKHLDLHYCSIYFIMTELLLCYDSRGKNMMFATWGPHEKDGEYIWYPIFYDIDTLLGVNNSGVPTWDYDINATEKGQFSTSNSVLWNNFWSCFRETIVSTYNQLRKGALNFENLNGYYSFDPEVSGSYAMMGCRPINIMNVDEYFKYIAPTFTGFTTTAGTVGHDGGAHFYCLQGDRALQRELFLRNRFNFIDSAWTAGTYDITLAKNMKFRYNANATGTSDKYVERELGDVAGDDLFIAQGGTQASYPQPLDTTANWTVVPYLKQSVSMYFDEILQPTTPIPFNGEGKVEIEPTETILKEIKNTTNFTQLLVYFGGIQYISSFGDLSLKYLDEITLGEAIRLRDLVIGNDTEGFVNSKLNDNNFKIGDDANNENRKALLEKIVLTNLSGLREIIDVGGSEKLKEFRALGTNIAGVTLSDGTQIEVLHLPSTISQLQIVEPIALTNILTDKTLLKNEDGSWKPGIFIDGVTNKTLDLIGPDDTSAIITFRINGGNMGYDSYKLLKTIVEIKKKMHEKIEAGLAIPGGINPRLSIEVTDVAWTPYRLVESGESVVGGSTYVKKTDHYTFEDYTPGVNWESDTLNGRIYEVDLEKLAEAGEITSLEMFDTFIASYLSSDNYFRSTTEAIGGANTLPTITGDVFINNSEELPISEDDLKNKYIDANFKDLRIYAKYVDKAYVAKFVEILDSGVEYEWDTHRYNRNTTSHPEASKVTPTKLHFDFVGWADKPNAGEADVILDWSKYTFSSSRDSYTFYAVYVVHRYTVEFYNDDELVETMKITYNTNLKKCTKIPYKDDSMLELTKCYGFVGWTDDNTRAGLVQNLNSIVDVESLIATKDYKFYACFLEKDVLDNVLSEEYLVCSNLNYNYVDEFDHQYDISGVLIEVKEGVVLSGKITIPNTFLGYPVVALGSMTFRDSINNETLTHVFFEGGGTSLRVFSTRAFYNALALLYIDIPLLLRVVDQEALSGIPKLPFTDTKNICQLGRTAVGRTGGSSGLSGATLHIGSEMRAMAAQCIQYNGTSYGGGTILIGEPGQPTKMILSRLENRAFNQNDNGLPSKMVVYIEAGRHDEPQLWINDGKFLMARGCTLDVLDI